MVSAYEGNPNPSVTDLEICTKIVEENSSFDDDTHSVLAGRLLD